MDRNTSSMILNPEELRKHFDQSWYSALEPEMNKDYFQNALASLKAESTAKRAVYPKFKDMWKPWTLPIDKVRVVIVNEQPHQSSDGLAFSTQSMTMPAPTVEIFKEIYFSDFQKTKGVDLEDCFCCGDLFQWHRQGVMLLNSCLTTGEAPNEHKMFGWQRFTEETIKLLNKQEEPIVFIFFDGGSFLSNGLIDITKHEVILVNKIKDSKCFTKCNEFLRTRYPEQPSINWGVWTNFCQHYVVRILCDDWKEIPHLKDRVTQEFRLPTYFKPYFDRFFGKEWMQKLTENPSPLLYRWFTTVLYSEKLKSPRKGKELLYEEDNFLYWAQTVGRELCETSQITIDVE